MTTARRWALTIEGWLPPSELGTNGRRRLSHWRQRDLTQQAKIRVALALRQVAWAPSTPLERARVVITLIFPVKRRRDLDNCYARVKVIGDSLVQEGFLVDDDTEHLELVVRAEVRPGVSATRIEVEEIDGE